MTHLSRPATGLLPRLTHRLGTTCRSARMVTRATLLCLAIGAAPAAHAQSIQGLFASDAREQGGRPVAVTPRKDWRNTLDRQEREGEGGQQRRKMSEEERSILRQHMRDAARGAYRDEAPPRKGRR